MGKVIVGMTMSLDGYVNDRNGSVERLYPDMESMRESESLQQAMRSTGAVVMGRATYDMAQGDFTNYEFQVPIFVVTHQAPAEVARGENERLRFTFVSEGPERAVELARAAAGDRDVTVVGGPSLIRQLLAAGLADELEVGIAPVLLCGGLRLFDELGVEPLALEQLQVLESPGRVDLRFRVVR